MKGYERPRARAGSIAWLSETVGPVLADDFFQEQYTAWVEQYRNLMLSPRGLNGSNPANYGTGGNGNYSTVYTGGPDGGVFKRMTWTVANSGGAAYLAFSLPPTYGTPVTALGVYTVSAYVRTSVAHSVRLAVAGHTDSSGSGWIGCGNTAATPLNAGEWTRLSFVMTVPATVTHVRVIVGDVTGQNYAIGETLDATCMMITSGSTPLPFFDPGIGWTQVARGRWVGTPHASQSVYETRSIVDPSAFVRIWAKISGVLSLFRLGAVKSGGSVVPVSSAAVKDGGVLKPVV